MRTLKGKSVLVTGGAGFIGSHVADRLIEEVPSEIVVVDLLLTGKLKNIEHVKKNFKNFTFYKEDICNFNSLKKIISKHKIDIVFHLAVKPLPESLVKPREVFDSVTQGTLNLCELAREGAFELLVNTSSSEVYGTAKYVPMDEKHPMGVETPYAAAKAAADLILQSYVRTFGIKALTVRPFNTYGPRQNDGNYAGVIPITIKHILRGENPVVYGTGNQTRDFSFVKDIADSFILAAKYGKEGETYNFASGKETSVNCLIKNIINFLNYKGKIIYDKPRPGDVMRHLADVSKAKAQLLFVSQIALSDGLTKTIRYI